MSKNYFILYILCLFVFCFFFNENGELTGPERAQFIHRANVEATHDCNSLSPFLSLLSYFGFFPSYLFPHMHLVSFFILCHESSSVTMRCLGTSSSCIDVGMRAVVLLLLHSRAVDASRHQRRGLV